MDGEGGLSEGFIAESADGRVREQKQVGGTEGVRGMGRTDTKPTCLASPVPPHVSQFVSLRDDTHAEHTRGTCPHKV